MIEIAERLHDPAARADDELRLPFELRQRSRLRARLASGEEVAIALARGEIVRGGDRLRAADGRVVAVVAAPERVVHVACADAAALARAAYHLGNRHVPVEVGAGYLRIGADHVLEEMLRGLGATLTALEAPFEPEAGAYGHRHPSHADSGHGGRIHEYGASAESSVHHYSHEHVHPHAHEPER